MQKQNDEQTVKQTENQGNNSILSFKLSQSNKEKLTLQADSLGLSVSEYVRIKLFLDENESLKYYEENEKLKQQIKEYQVKETLHKASKIDPGSIVLQTREGGKELIKLTLNNMLWHLYPKRNKIIETDNDIIEALLHLLTRQLWDGFCEMPDLIQEYKLHNPVDYYDRVWKAKPLRSTFEWDDIPWE